MRIELAAPGLVVALTMIGCGGSRHEQRYDEMSAALREARRPQIAFDEALFEGAPALDRAALVEAVLARNPSVEAARQAWAAALADYDQATSLDDPMASYMFAPLSIAGGDRYGQVIQVSQRFPYPGKLRLRGAIEVAEAEAAESDYHSILLDLALAASVLYDDYYAVARGLEINADHRELLQELKESAEAQYTVGRAAQQDPIQAEVELAHVAHQRVVLEAGLAVIKARLNGLLHRPPTALLPAPPAELIVPDALVLSVDAIQGAALENRPDIVAAMARIKAAGAAVDLANREYYPDFEIMGQYNSMWGTTEHRWMAGVGVNIPLQRGRRGAAVDRAEALVAQTRSQVEALIETVRVEVATAVERAREAHHVVELYRSTVLPATEDQVQAARAGFIADQNSFLAVIEAEKNQRDAQLAYERALAQLQRRLAELQRVAGEVPGLTPPGTAGAARPAGGESNPGDSL